MADLYKALAQIHAIRGQVARGTEFRGYGPETVAATGLLAGAAAVLCAALGAVGVGIALVVELLGHWR